MRVSIIIASTFIELSRIVVFFEKLLVGGVSEREGVGSGDIDGETDLDGDGVFVGTRVLQKPSFGVKNVATAGQELIPPLGTVYETEQKNVFTKDIFLLYLNFGNFSLEKITELRSVWIKFPSS